MEIVKDFAALPTEEARVKYGLGKDAEDWKVGWAQEDLSQAGVDEKLVAPVLYRPFDKRSTYYTGKSRGFICRPRQEVMRHMLTGANLGLITTRQCQQNWDALATSTIIGHKALATYDLNSLFPLYTYPTEQQEQIGQTREPNLSAAFVETIASCLDLAFTPEGSGDLKKTVGPEDLFHFIYAVLHSPEYRTRYADFLKSDFARVPVTTHASLFAELVALGRCLTSLHLMEAPAGALPSYPEQGSNQVAQVRYAAPKGGTSGRVHINKQQYFEGVSPHTWELTIGGYRPAEKWLQDRKGRTLGYDDIEHYRRICGVLVNTPQIMVQIDQAIQKYGEWPLK